MMDDDTYTPVGCQKFTYHMILDVRMDSPQKDLWMLDGHKIPYQIVSTHAGVVFRDSVWIVFTNLALNK